MISMRKLIAVGVLAAVAIAVLAVPAFASFDRHFSVISKGVSERNIPNGFVFKDKLLDPNNRQDRVGRVRGKCRIRREARKVRCHAVVHLNGNLGGFGDIRVRGDLGRGDNRLNVVGGTGDFDGVAGKILLHNLGRNTDKLHFDLVR
jgi:hypothetical protein